MEKKISIKELGQKNLRRTKLKTLIYLKSFLLILAITFVLVACNSNINNPDDKPAILVSLTEIENEPGYIWFPLEYQSYKPDSVRVDSIKKAYNLTTDSVLIFVNPSCSCSGTVKQFPDIMKILLKAGFPESQCKIYSMLSYRAPHPYTSMLTLHQLPAAFLLRNNKVVYSVFDSLTAYQGLTTDTLSIEEYVLKAFSHK